MNIKNKKLKIFLYGTIILVSILFLSLIFINGSFLTKEYLEPWDKTYYEQFDDPRTQVIAHGLLAPNAHNKQSWKVVLNDQDSTKFDLFLDEERLLPETDPHHRQTIMSHGTFLELIDISAQKLGYKANVEIFPKGEINEEGSIEDIRAKPIATISLTQSDIENPPLYEAIFDRVTTRTPYLDKPLTDEQIKIIESLNSYDGIGIKIFQNSDDLEKIKQLALAGVEIESKNKDTMQESHDVLRFNEYVKNKHRDGLTLSSNGWSGFRQWFMEALSTVFSISLEQEGEIWNDGAKERIPQTPAYILILSEKDDRTTHVKIGMLYSRIQLAGTSLGLSMQPTMQITQEYPEMAELYEETNEKFAENGQKVQMLFRVGEAEKKVEHAPRRDVMELIINK